jgi:hypothetical protein
MASLEDILSTMQNGVNAIRDLTVQIREAFPPLTHPTSVAPSAGAVTYNSSQVSGFATVETSSGGVYKIALLPSS